MRITSTILEIQSIEQNSGRYIQIRKGIDNKLASTSFLVFLISFYHISINKRFLIILVSFYMLENKVAVVTGASSGIGYATSLKLSKAGIRVAGLWS